MSSKREQLELLVQTMKTRAAQIDSKASGATPAEIAEVNKMGADVKRLIGEVRAENRKSDTFAGRTAAEHGLGSLDDLMGSVGSGNRSPGFASKAFGGNAGSSWGDAVVKASSPDGYFKALLATGSTAVSVPLAPDPVRPGQRVEFLRQLIPVEKDDAGRFSYLRQTTRTNLAAVVAPGAVKPTSVYTLTRIDDRARTIAHVSEQIPRQDVDDAALLSQFIEQEMRYGLDLALDTEIMTGDGTGEHFLGILAATSGVQTQAWSTNLLTTLRKAITALQAINLTPDGFVLNPADWERVELVADTAGQFVAGAPANQAGPPIDPVARRLWGIPVLVSNAVTAGVGVLADFAGSTRLWIREEARIDWSENVASDYISNLLRFRCEMRAGFGLLRPLGCVSIDLTA